MFDIFFFQQNDHQQILADLKSIKSFKYRSRPQLHISIYELVKRCRKGKGKTVKYKISIRFFLLLLIFIFNNFLFLFFLFFFFLFLFFFFLFLVLFLFLFFSFVIALSSLFLFHLPPPFHQSLPFFFSSYLDFFAIYPSCS